MTEIYLDYSATTKPSSCALEAFASASSSYGNPNSVHGMGLRAKALIDKATAELSSLLGACDKEIIYTSGATEANNLAIMGCFERFSGAGRTHIITTEFEHSSVIATISALAGQGASIDFVPLCSDGRVDIDALRSLVRDDTLLVSVGCVASELGIRQPIEEIGRILKSEFPGVLFHSDITQAVGKCCFDLTDVDLASLSAHKFYGFKGVGALLKRKDLVLVPQNRGGSSTTRFRSGTPATELIVSMAAALRETLDGFDEKVAKVASMNRLLRRELSRYDKVVVNSPCVGACGAECRAAGAECGAVVGAAGFGVTGFEDAGVEFAGVPQILNVSVLGVAAEETQKWFDERGVCFSTRSACVKGAKVSKAVESLTGDEARAASSVRISLSYKTTQEEICQFLGLFDEFYQSVVAGLRDADLEDAGFVDASLVEADLEDAGFGER